ncbi:putative ankyrin repeat protein [Teratosphaeria destructans]|uniref:Ankyrin repeat protein n=1 Tax=Teratosphaeria destructans TaxID=418781 RepID=A0A9W7T0G6_9PEZI|nr:putative ankyrin repeat protein [Teratosphaeria destructans]
MAPKKGKETPLELCTIILSLGNSIAVHLLEYLSDAKVPRDGSRELALEFLESSRALFHAKTGLQEANNVRTAFPGDIATELQTLFRQYNNNFVVMNQMVNKLLDNERKQGFSKLGNGFRMMFASDEIEKMRLSLVQCRENASKNPLMLTWRLREVKPDTVTSIGYTALAAVLDRPDPTKSIAPSAHSVAQVPSPVVPHEFNGKPYSQSLPHEFNGKPYSQSSRASLHRDIPSPPLSESALHDAQFFGGLSKATTPSNVFSTRSAALGTTADYISEITPPSSIQQMEDMMYSHDLEDLPKKATYAKYDPSTVARWKPKAGGATISAGSRGALLVAVQEQNHKAVEHLLDCGVPADGGPECNLLRLAVTNHDIDSVRLLLLFGASPDGKDKDGFTPLYAATESSFFLAAQLLLKYGADPNACAGLAKESPLALSLNEGKVGFVQLYLKHGAKCDGIMANGETPFIQSMNKSTTIDLVEWMLVYDADPNVKNDHGESPLFKAINADRLDLVATLLDHGANPNLPGPKHMLWPAVHRPRMLQLLLERGAKVDRAPGIVELAASINSIEVVQILLKHGADPNAKKDGIFTPLCTSIRDNRDKLVEILLAAGADPNLMASEYPAFKCVTHHRAHILPRLLAAGSDPHTPKGIIEECVAHNNEEAMLLLLKHKVDPNAHNKAGHTALTTAIKKNDLRAIEILLAHGASPTVHGQEWPINMAVKQPEILAKLLPHTPTHRVPKGALELAVQADKLESIKLLLAKGVDVEERNGGVFSPLTTSIREDRKAIFQFLLDEAGADPNSPGEHLPIIKAIRRHREDDLSYIKHLIAKGADINLMYRGWNAVLQALDKGDTQTLRLLAEVGTPDLTVVDENGQTVMEILRDRDMKEEEQILLKGKRTPSPKIELATRGLREFVKQDPPVTTARLPHGYDAL